MNKAQNDVADGRQGQALRPRRMVLPVLAVALLGSLGLRGTTGYAAGARPVHRPVPTSSAIENVAGVRIKHVAVVGGGGLVDVRYDVIDPDKALRLQEDTSHPPTLDDEQRPGHVSEAALMKQGHTLRAGQTYYILYHNTGGKIRPGDDVTVNIGSLRLAHVPVDK